ncbi:MAG: T9SS type A sorting domain-containing protein [Bacteroidales bacterium]|nr:T9SS type A sorting domain-containing protein [Bacteroidales bacterium]
MKWRYITIILLLLANVTQVKAQEGLIAHWSFDETEGDTIYDKTGNGNHGTVYGAERIDGVSGNALSFDGEDDYARIPGDGEAPPSVLSELGEGSISLWFKVNHIPTNYGIAPIFYYGAEEKCDFFDAANKGLIIELGHSPIHYGSERLYFTIWKNGCTYPSFCYDSNHAIPEGEWHHLVVVVRGDYNTGYLNGEEMVNRRYNFGDASYSQFFADAIAHEKLWLGKGHWDRTTQHYDGAIDELRIYSNPLSEAEVKNLYNGQSVPTAVTSPPDDDSGVRIYPNPVSDRLFFDIRNPDEEVRHIKILDVTGKVLDNKTEIFRNGSIDTKRYPGGVYYAVFYGGGKRYRKRFLVLD